MSKSDKIIKIQKLLNQSLGLTDFSNEEASQARQHIKKAIDCLNKMNKKENKKQLNIAKDWWEDIVSGVANGKTSPQSQMRSLEQLNSMISEEQKKLNELESKAQEKPNKNTSSPEVLND